MGTESNLGVFNACLCYFRWITVFLRHRERIRCTQGYLTKIHCSDNLSMGFVSCRRIVVKTLSGHIRLVCIAGTFPSCIDAWREVSGQAVAWLLPRGELIFCFCTSVSCFPSIHHSHLRTLQHSFYCLLKQHTKIKIGTFCCSLVLFCE